jgi:hypothetical protein
MSLNIGMITKESYFLSAWQDNNVVTEYKKFTVVSTFSGCGGMDLGFVQAGYDVVWAVPRQRQLDSLTWLHKKRF